MAKRLDMRLKMRFRLVRPLKSAMKTDIVFELLSIFMADHNCGLSIFVFDIQLFDIHLFLSYVNRGKEKKEEKFVFSGSSHCPSTSVMAWLSTLRSPSPQTAF